jgi:hypothetical protein
MAGAGSETLAGARGLYVPLKGIKNNMGVLGIRPTDPKDLHDPEQLQLLETFASEIGGAVESTRMSEEIGRAELQMEMQAIKNPGVENRIRVGDFLEKERVVILGSGLSKEQIFQELLRHLKVANPTSSLTAMLRYDAFTTGKIEFEFYIWKEKKASVTVSPNFSFPNVKFKVTNIVSSYINEEQGFL